MDASVEKAWLRAEKAWACVWRPLQRFIAAVGGGISRLVSREGLPSWGYILLVMSLWFGWIHLPFFGSVPATRLSVLPGDLSWGASGRRLLSYGTFVLLLLLYTWLTRPGARWARFLPRFLRRPYGFHAAAGLGVACLAFWFFLTAAFLRPDLLEALIEQTAEFHRIKQFDNAYIQGNVGVVRIPYLTSDTLWNQMDGLFTNLGMGFWYALMGSGCLFVAGLGTLRRERREAGAGPRPPAPLALGVAAAVALVLVLIAGVLAGQSLVADALAVRAGTLADFGDNARAFQIYRKARNIDHRLAINETFLERMGRAAYRSGDRRSPEAHFFLANRYRWSFDYANADYHIRQAIAALEASGRTRTLPAYRKFREKLHVYWGRSLYEKAQYQGALDRWHVGLALDPDSFELPFYLAHAYYHADGTDQSRAIELNQRLLGRVKDRILRSDLYCNLGEAYYRQKDYARARHMYERSLDMYNFVKDINYRAQRGMLGIGT